VDFALSGTATEGAAADYTYAPASPLVFGAAETTKDITFTINDDSLFELTEDIIVSITPDANGVAAGSPQTVTINDDGVDKYTATLSGGMTVTEASTTVTLTVTLDQPVPGGATVDFALSGTATEGAAADYTYAPASPLVFGAAETTKDMEAPRRSRLMMTAIHTTLRSRPGPRPLPRPSAPV
jgi:hypothetical protein